MTIDIMVYAGFRDTQLDIPDLQVSPQDLCDRAFGVQAPVGSWACTDRRADIT